MGRGGFILSGPDSLYLCSSAPLPLVTTDMKPERTTCIDQAVVHKAKCVEGLCRGQQDPHGPCRWCRTSGSTVNSGMMVSSPTVQHRERGGIGAGTPGFNECMQYHGGGRGQIVVLDTKRVQIVRRPQEERWEAPALGCFSVPYPPPIRAGTGNRTRKCSRSQGTIWRKERQGNGGGM